MSCLLHVCCGNCLSDVALTIKEKFNELELYWANPNIHPLVEWRKRRKSVRLMASRLGLKLHEEPYGLHRFLHKIGDIRTRNDGRCLKCYRLRLGLTAKKAHALSLEYFSSTLLVSKLQEHADIMAAGEAAAEKYNVKFYAPELRDNFQCDAARPRDLHLYKQSYCGCIFSEEERFIDSNRGK